MYATAGETYFWIKSLVRASPWFVFVASRASTWTFLTPCSFLIPFLIRLINFDTRTKPNRFSQLIHYHSWQVKLVLRSPKWLSSEALSWDFPFTIQLVPSYFSSTPTLAFPLLLYHPKWTVPRSSWGPLSAKEHLKMLASLTTSLFNGQKPTTFMKDRTYQWSLSEVFLPHFSNSGCASNTSWLKLVRYSDDDELITSGGRARAYPMELIEPAQGKLARCLTRDE